SRVRIGGRREPETVAVPREDTELGPQSRDGAQDVLVGLPVTPAGIGQPGEVVLGEEVAEDAATHRSLSSSLWMNSASSPAASRPARWKVAPRARSGRRGQVRWLRQTSQADSSSPFQRCNQVQPKRTCSI